MPITSMLCRFYRCAVLRGVDSSPEAPRTVKLREGLFAHLAADPLSRRPI